MRRKSQPLSQSTGGVKFPCPGVYACPTCTRLSRARVAQDCQIAECPGTLAPAPTDATSWSLFIERAAKSRLVRRERATVAPDPFEKSPA